MNTSQKIFFSLRRYDPWPRVWSGQWRGYCHYYKHKHYRRAIEFGLCDSSFQSEAVGLSTGLYSLFPSVTVSPLWIMCDSTAVPRSLQGHSLQDQLPSTGRTSQSKPPFQGNAPPQCYETVSSRNYQTTTC